MISESAPRPPKPKPKMLAKLEGKVSLPDRDVSLKYIIRKPSILMGRSDHTCTHLHPFKPAKEGVHLGLGVSSKLSRAHARIDLDRHTRRFYIHCLGKNGITVTKPGDDATEIRLTPDSEPMLLASKTVIKLADCVLAFILPSDAHASSSDKSRAPHKPPPSTEQPKKRKKRLWIKSEHTALRTSMMRLGYGRWEEIVANANGRLAEREPSELIPVAREFVAHCYVHARPGVEQKSLMEILREEPVSKGMPEEEISRDVDELIESCKQIANPDEKRKYVRWARKLRLLSRLRDVHDHPSLQRLRRGELRVFTPPPALYWTSGDDADLILGSYKHGYGSMDAMRTDPELGFHGRYSRATPPKKAGTPSKTSKSADTLNGSEDDDEDDEDVDEDEDERHGVLNDDMDDENGTESTVHNPRKRMKLGNRSIKKEDGRSDAVSVGMEDSDVSPNRSPDHKPDGNESEKNSDHDQMNDDADKKKKKPVRMVPKRGPRIGNDDGFNNPEDAKIAFEKAADKEGLVPFPSSESLMRRLKSIINSCAKEYDRDQREWRRKKLAASRAQQRKDDLAARKAEKEAERTRQREERRIAKSQPFSKKEAVEFEKALANFGIVYERDGKTIDWSWFQYKVNNFDLKYDSTLNAAYIELLGEAHRISDLAAAKDDEDNERVEKLNDGKKVSSVFSTLTPDRAERLIERLQFFRVLRGEVLPHKNINSILRGFKKTRDLPPWWKSSHDRSLLNGVNRHGFNGWDSMAFDDGLQFASSMKTWQKKNGNDPKALKRAAMPKASVGIKRAFNLVQYFRSRANDPHFEHFVQDDIVTGRDRNDGDEDKSKSRPRKQEEKPVKMEDVEESKSELDRSGDDRAIKSKRKSDALFQPASSGRPRTLRTTIVEIPQDESGQLMLPTDLGDGLFLLCLGEIRLNRPGFCKNGIVFPVGYRTVRQIGSHAFLCEIFESEDGHNPEFRVSALEGFDPSGESSGPLWSEASIIAQSLNIVTLWLKVVNELNSNSENDGRIALASGPERFGLYEPTIVYHVQKLPGARSVKGFELRDFSREGEGRKIEPTVGVLGAMMKGIENKLERPGATQNFDAVLTGQDDGPRERLVLATESEMSVPEEWILKFGGSRKKNRRKSSSHWG